MASERKTPEEIIAAAEAWAATRLQLFVVGLTIGGLHTEEDAAAADDAETKAAEALIDALGRSPR